MADRLLVAPQSIFYCANAYTAGHRRPSWRHRSVLRLDAVQIDVRRAIYLEGHLY